MENENFPLADKGQDHSISLLNSNSTNLTPDEAFCRLYWIRSGYRGASSGKQVMVIWPEMQRKTTLFVVIAECWFEVIFAKMLCLQLIILVDNDQLLWMICGSL